MRFKSSQVKGKGRGKSLGFPTINLEIPENLDTMEGIYAVKVWIEKKIFIGAMHFGPIPTFKETGRTLEIFLIDTKDSDIPMTEIFEVETVQYLRPVLNFPSQEDLSKQIAQDVIDTRKILNLA